MAKEKVAYSFRPLRASADIGHVFPVFLSGVTTDTRDRDRPLRARMTAQDARTLAAQLIAAAEWAEQAVRPVDLRESP